MEKQNIKVLYFCEIEDNIKGNILAVSDSRLFGTKEFKKRVKEEVGYLVDIENETDEDAISDFKRAVRNLAKGKSAVYMDYEFEYEDLDLMSL